MVIYIGTSFPNGDLFVSTASEKIERGFYIEAPALLSFRLPPGAKSFHATLGMEKSAEGKGTVQVYASDEAIPFPKGKHTDCYFFSGPGNTSVEAAKKWWVIYSALVGYGKSPGSKEMVEVSLGKEGPRTTRLDQAGSRICQTRTHRKVFHLYQEKKIGAFHQNQRGRIARPI